MPRARVKKNDVVVVITGKYRGKRGRVLRVVPKKSLVLVEGVGIVKRHTRPNPQKNIKGGVVDKEAPIAISNVMPIDPETDRAAKVGRKRLEDGRWVRIARASGAVLDK